MFYTLGLVGQFIFRFYHLCSALPPAVSRRAIKIRYRIASGVTAILFGSLFAWMAHAYLAYEIQCEDDAIYDETK